MKSYLVLCMTCNGSGYTILQTGNISSGNTIPCPVCNGSKTQMVHETDSGKLIQVALQNGTISIADAFKLIQ